MAKDMIESSDGFRAPRDVWRSLLRGFALRCPNCAKGLMFHRYLKVSDWCPSCGEELHHHRADDAGAAAPRLSVSPVELHDRGGEAEKS